MDPLSLVPLHFEQLKELRNGTISYIQIVKRDRTRPPVRPVCRRLGVAKLAEIETEEDMYHALVSVAEAQIQKSNSNASHSSANSSDGHDFSGVDRLQDLDDQYGGEFSLKDHRMLSTGTDRYYGRNSYEQAWSVPDFNQLARCIFTIRSGWGNPQQIARACREHGIPEDWVFAALESIYNITGCRDVDLSVDADSIIQALNYFYDYQVQQVQGQVQGGRDWDVPRDSQTDAAAAGGLYPRHFASSEGAQRRFVEKQSSLSVPLNDPHRSRLYSAASNSHPAPPFADYAHKVNTRPPVERFAGSQERADMPGGSGYETGRPAAAAAAPLNSGSSSVVFDPYGLNGARYSAPTNTEPLSQRQLANVTRQSTFPAAQGETTELPQQASTGYEKFWSVAWRLFKSALTSDASVADSLAILQELSAVCLSDSADNVVMLASLDIVANRACAEISAKGWPERSTETMPDVHGHASSRQSIDEHTDMIANLDACVQGLTQHVLLCCERCGVACPRSSQLKNELQEQVTWLKHRVNPFTPDKTRLFNPQAIRDASAFFCGAAAGHISAPGLSEVHEQIAMRLEHSLQLWRSRCSVFLFGAAAMGTLEKGGGVVDMTLLLPELETMEGQKSAERLELQRTINMLESDLKTELEFERVIKFVTHCIDDVDDTSANLAAYAPAVTNTSTLGAHVEDMYKTGIAFVERQVHMSSVKRSPAVSAAFARLAKSKKELRELQTSLHIVRERALAMLENMVRDYRYSHVQLVKNGQTSALHFVDEDSPIGATRCKLVIGRPLFVHSSRLLAAYLRLDASGKVMAYTAFIRKFVKDHNLCGQLSLYGWTVLCIHVLLKFQFVPNIQDNYQAEIPSLCRTFCGDIDVTTLHTPCLSIQHVNKIAQTSVFELIILFFRYWALDADVLGSVFTLRRQGEVLQKSSWGEIQEKKAWRLSIEDPFECIGTPNPTDLGKQITRQEQNLIFSTLSRCSYALCGLLERYREDTDSVPKCIAAILSRDRLLQIAFKGGYSIPQYVAAPVQDPPCPRAAPAQDTNATPSVDDPSVTQPQPPESSEYSSTMGMMESINVFLSEIDGPSMIASIGPPPGLTPKSRASKLTAGLSPVSNSVKGLRHALSSSSGLTLTDKESASSLDGSGAEQNWEDEDFAHIMESFNLQMWEPLNTNSNP